MKRKKPKPAIGDRQFTVETGEIKERRECGFSLPMPVIKSFQTYEEARRYALSVGQRDITEIKNIGVRNWEIVATWYVNDTATQESPK